MSNSFNTELKVQARTSNASTGNKSFTSWDQEGLGAAASDFLNKVVFLPVFMSLFTSVISPTVPKNHLQNSEFCYFSYFFVAQLILNYLEGCTQGLPASGKLPDYQDSKLFLSRQNQPSVGSVSKSFPVKLVTHRKFCCFQL